MADETSHEGPDGTDWCYRGALMLAPMVRINHLPFRLLAAEYGADMVYSEELVDRSILACRRTLNERLGTADYCHPDGKLIFRVRPRERVVLQLGTASAAEALRAAQVVGSDVRAIDINMGCPVKFSTQGGMGSALLTQPEKVRDILRTLVSNLSPLPVTCKIRLLDSTHETLQLARLIADTGVSALAVHTRRRHDRPRHWAQWDQLPLVRSVIGSLPLILNGDVFHPDDIPRAFKATGADSLMLARGAMWNASLFRRGAPLLPQSAVVARYVALCEETENPFGNSKYVALQMLDGGGKTAAFRMLQQAKDYPALRAAAAACASESHFLKESRPPLCLEPPPDMPHAAALPVNRWRQIPPHCKSARTAREAAVACEPAAEAAEAAEGVGAADASMASAHRGAEMPTVGMKRRSPPPISAPGARESIGQDGMSDGTEEI